MQEMQASRFQVEFTHAKDNAIYQSDTQRDAMIVASLANQGYLDDQTVAALARTPENHPYHLPDHYRWVVVDQGTGHHAPASTAHPEKTESCDTAVPDAGRDEFAYYKTKIPADRLATTLSGPVVSYPRVLLYLNGHAPPEAAHCFFDRNAVQDEWRNCQYVDLYWAGEIGTWGIGSIEEDPNVTMNQSGIIELAVDTLHPEVLSRGIQRAPSIEKVAEGTAGLYWEVSRSKLSVTSNPKMVIDTGVPGLINHWRDITVFTYDPDITPLHQWYLDQDRAPVINTLYIPPMNLWDTDQPNRLSLILLYQEVVEYNRLLGQEIDNPRASRIRMNGYHWELAKRLWEIYHLHKSTVLGR